MIHKWIKASFPDLLQPPIAPLLSYLTVRLDLGRKAPVQRINRPGFKALYG